MCVFRLLFSRSFMVKCLELYIVSIYLNYRVPDAELITAPEFSSLNKS